MRSVLRPARMARSEIWFGPAPRVGARAAPTAADAAASSGCPRHPATGLAPSYQSLLACVILTTDSMTGTSTSTPTTVASAAPDSKPNRPIAVGHRELEEVAGADQGGGRRHAMRDAEPAVEQIGEPGIEVDLDQDRHGEQHDHQRLPQDLLALEAEQQDQGRQQGEQRDRLQAARAAAEAPARHGRPGPCARGARRSPGSR